jgi:hypothetical protein
MDIVDIVNTKWYQVDGSESEGPTYRRPLGPLELSFYWDAAFNGVAVLVNHIEFDVERTCEADILSGSNIARSWIRMKQRFPLLGASTAELPSSEMVEFVVREHALLSVRPGEVTVCHNFQSTKDVNRFEEELINGPTVLSNEFLARVWIGPQKDMPYRYHVFIPVVHLITDGIGNATIAREFCQELSSLPKDTIVRDPPLQTRLQGLLPVEAFTPGAKLSAPRRRWRLAIAKTIQDIRLSRLVVRTSHIYCN